MRDLTIIPSESAQAAPSPSVVRVAQPSDEEELMDMLRLMHKESGFRDEFNQPFPIDEELVRGTVQKAIIRDRNALDVGQSCCGIIGEPGNLQASVCLGIGATWYSRRPFLGDYFTYVKADYRRSGHARSLIRFAIKIAIATRLDLRMGNVTLERTAAKDRFFERLGFKTYGQTFFYSPFAAPYNQLEHGGGGL